MKIYTEEQVKVLISALDDIRDWDDDLEVEYDDAGNRAIDALKSFNNLTPIEIPSDLQDFHKWIEDNEWYFNPISFNGVIKYRWVKEFWCGQETTNELYKIYIEEQILKQNK